MNAHPTALIHPATRIAEDVLIGPFCVIEDGVEIGAGTVLAEHVVIRSGTAIATECRIDANAVIGGLPQDLGFDPATPTGVRIGNGVTIREGVTISRATREATFTAVGDRCFLMANSHVAHDCLLGDEVILANGVLLGGHVHVGNCTFMGGAAAVHQFIRIGAYAMISGVSRVSMDMPPFCMMAERNELCGLNLVGLQRRGFSRNEIRDIKLLYHAVYDAGANPRKLAGELIASGAAQTARGAAFLEFIAIPSKKSIMRPVKRGSYE